ncbi:MAG: tetratricopeptide repeat protein [Acidobacteria bacterium]|nr:tetratricopeptide repeat protein [Acidobacteriota bacterium]
MRLPNLKSSISILAGAARLLALGLIACAFAGIGFAQRTASAPTAALTVKTEPGAKIWLNNIYFGTAGENGELTIKLPPKPPIEVRARAAGFAPAVVKAGTSRTVNVVLKPTEDAAELAFQDAERQSLIDRREAIKLYEKAIELRPTFTEAHLARARMLIEIIDPFEAERSLAAARKLEPSNPEISAIAGRIYREEGDFARAEAAFKRSIIEGKGFQPEALTGLGMLYADRGETPREEDTLAATLEFYTLAEKNLRMAAEQLAGAPDAKVVLQYLGRLLERQGKADEAIALYRKFLQIFPDSVEATAVRSFIEQLERQQ